MEWVHAHLNLQALLGSVPVFSLQFVGLLAAVVWLDLLLSGDNAVVIALVARGLPRQQQRMGMLLGVGAAIALRIIMSFFAATLILVPGLRIFGALWLLYIAVGMLKVEGDEEAGNKPAVSLLKAIFLIGVADASMSLDNVIALAGLSNGNLLLMVLGILISIPFVIAGAEIIKRVVDHLPLLIWAGAALLGWVAGGILVTDPFLVARVKIDPNTGYYAASAIGAIIVLALGWWVRVPDADERVTQSSGNIFDDIGVPTPSCYKHLLPDAKHGYSSDHAAYGITPEHVKQVYSVRGLADNWSEISRARNFRREGQEERLRRISAADMSTFGNLN